MKEGFRRYNISVSIRIEYYCTLDSHVRENDTFFKRNCGENSLLNISWSNI